MNIKEIRYFVELSKEENFTKASSNLMISQPALSKAIKMLEHDLGFDLLDRKCYKKFKLTHEGLIFYEHAKNALKNIDKEMALLKGCIKKCKNTLTIAIPPVMGIVYFTSIIAGFKKKYKDIEIKISEEGSNKIKEKILKKECDLGIIVTRFDHPEVENIEITEEEIAAVVYKGHKFYDREEICISELRDERLITLNSEFHIKRKTLELCEVEGFEPDVVIESSQWYFVLQMVAYKEGISILPAKIIDRFGQNDLKKIRIKGIPIQLHINCVYNINVDLNIPAQLFIEYLKSCSYDD